MTKQKLPNSLISGGYLKPPAIIEAFKKIDRADFVTEKYKNSAYVNEPLPIGKNQTISQPLTVAFMLELLEPKAGEKILDIGAGSGWTTSLLARIVGEKGRVFGVEIIPELFEFGKKNIEKYPHQNIELFNQSGYNGLSEKAPFDKVLISAAAPEVPKELKEQLVIGGKLVIPVRNSIFEIERKEDNKFKEKEHFEFSFVPLVQN